MVGAPGNPRSLISMTISKLPFPTSTVTPRPKPLSPQAQVIHGSSRPCLEPPGKQWQGLSQNESLAVPPLPMVAGASPGLTGCRASASPGQPRPVLPRSARTRASACVLPEPPAQPRPASLPASLNFSNSAPGGLADTLISVTSKNENRLPLLRRRSRGQGITVSFTASPAPHPGGAQRTHLGGAQVPKQTSWLQGSKVCLRQRGRPGQRAQEARRGPGAVRPAPLHTSSHPRCPLGHQGTGGGQQSEPPLVPLLGHVTAVAPLQPRRSALRGVLLAPRQELSGGRPLPSWASTVPWSGGREARFYLLLSWLQGQLAGLL